MAIFATLDELKARLDWTLDADEERIATSALEDASDLAVYYVGRDYADVSSAPRLVRTLVLKACKRYMTNPQGLTQSRAGDETLGWNDSQGQDAGTVYFTDGEQKLLMEIGGRKGGIISVGVSAWNSNISLYRSRTSGPHGNDLPAGFVPSSSGTDFPFYASDEDVW
ncbi:head-to-tail adaptor [Streptomyces phage Daudau]|uniref:Head-to-tail adaptor n=1 Tax=Streptomyces phage Daudau TaxID=2041206 RepID=A0A291LH20_9CAUD|nr:head-tail adaptor Ad1 [Streptomyces phage Daudau]ATI18712.1 head-to-tail adaptor [Streptomyces phage Daudau]